jgi:serine/threonine protein kinase
LLLFLPDLFHSFSDEENLYLVMEYISGGTLEELLKKYGEFGFNIDFVKFVSA